MKYKIKAAQPENIELELTVKMPLADWKRLREQIDSQSYPSHAFYSLIREMIDHAEKHFESEQDND